MTETPRLLAKRYEVGDLIGRGGMAEVHKGFDTRLGREVAIKMLRSDLARDQTFLARFRREAQSAAGLNHPAIVAIYDSGEDHVTEAGGAVLDVPFIVMEYVEGRTLREILTAGGAFAPAEAARVTEGVLDALAYSHRAGIVHRDIKPANVMIGARGEVKVMDFGIARAIADTNATMTQTQAVIGTAHYLSPEQAQGHTVDARSDLYSAGCMLFELLTGRAPFVGDTPVSIAYQHVGEQPQRASDLNPDVPEAYDDVVAHALEKDRERRYQDAEAFRRDLQSARLGLPVSASARGAAAALTGAAAAGAAGAAVTQQLPAAAAAAAAAVPARGDHGNTATLPAVGHDPDEEPQKRRGGTFALLALLVALLVGALVWGALRLSGPGEDPVTQATVPALVGMQQNAAEALLRARHLVPEPNQVASNEPEGQVIRQSHAEGTLVPVGTRVNFDVSAGPTTVTVPDVRNQSVDDARRILTDAGLVVGGKVESVDDSEVDRGNVDSTSPAAGVEVKTGSTVTLRVSSGKVTVPNVVGYAVDEAFTKVSGVGLVPKITYVESDQPEGRVLEQAPKDGKLDRGATVTLKVSKPRTATVTTTATVTATPTPTPTDTTGPPSTTVTTGPPPAPTTP